MLAPRDSARRLIIVLTQAELDRCEYDVEGAELLRAPGVWLVSDSAAQTDVSDPLVAGLDRSGLLSAGNVLMQMPYDPDVYEPVEDAPQRAAERKHLIFTELCQLLGATRVRLEVIETQSEKGEARVTLKGSTRSVSADGEVAKKSAEALAATMTLDDRYVGGDPEIAASEELLERTGLNTDPLMRSLINARRVGNVLHSRKYTVDLSRESSRQLKIAAQVKVPVFMSLSANVQTLTTAAEKHRATYEVSFT
jgi:hypothetical protein